MIQVLSKPQEEIYGYMFSKKNILKHSHGKGAAVEPYPNRHGCDKVGYHDMLCANLIRLNVDGHV